MDQPLVHTRPRLTSYESLEMASPSILNILFFEMFGIALLTLGVNNSVYSHIPDIFVATSLFVAIIYSGPFSGGHVNPAVTMGMINILCLGFVAKDGGLPVSSAAIYWAGQVVGGIVGSLLGVATVGKVNAPTLAFEDPEFLISDLIGQSIGTLVFVFFILLITNEVTTFSTNTLTTWACIAGALYIGRHYALRSGGCLNPGVAIGMQIVSMFIQGEQYIFKSTWVYAIGPLLGGYIAGKMFDRYLKTYIRVKKSKGQL